MKGAAPFLESRMSKKPSALDKFLLSPAWARTERAFNIIAAVGTIVLFAEPLRDMYYKKVLGKDPPKPEPKQPV